jgi:hypothetical protein
MVLEILGKPFPHDLTKLLRNWLAQNFAAYCL